MLSFWSNKDATEWCLAECTVSLSYLPLTYANVIKSHLITLGVTQLSTHWSTTRLASDYTSRIPESKWFNGDFHPRWQECQRAQDWPPCSPVNLTSAGISGDLELPLLCNRPLLLNCLLGEVATGKILRDDSNFLCPFVPSRAWSLKWHGNSPETAVDTKMPVVDLCEWT